MEIARENKRSIKELEAFEALYSVYNDKGDFRTALTFRNNYINLNDSIRSSETVQKIAELQTRYETEKKENEIKLARAELEKTNRFQAFLVIITAVIVVFAVVFSLQLRQKFHLKQKVQSHEIDNLRLQINALIGKDVEADFKMDYTTLNQKLNHPLSEREFEILEMAFGRQA